MNFVKKGVEMYMIGIKCVYLQHELLKTKEYEED